VIAVVLIIVVCIGIDQLTKAIARVKLLNTNQTKGIFSFSLVNNYGAFRGLLQKNRKALVFIQAISMFIIALILGIAIQRKDKVSSLGLSLILGGAMGNFIDRLKDGYVTDFFAIQWTKNLYYNLADMFIFIGAGIVLIKSMVSK
jgi:signal peptidase II